MDGSAWKEVKRIFLKGLAALIPTALTIYVLVFLFGFVKESISKPVSTFLWLEAAVRWESVQEHLIESYKVNPSYFEKEKDGSLKYGKELREDISRKLPWWPGFVLVVAAIFAAGIFLASFLGRRLWWLGEGVIKRVPIVKEVYSSAKQVTDFIFGGSKEGREYSRVVAVEYPMSGVWCVGFQTGWGLAPLKEREGKVVVSVFIPCSPVPMSGFTVIVPEEKVVHLQMSFDEAIQYVVSCGVVTPQLLTTEEGMASEKHLETGVRVSSLPSKEEKTKKGEKGKEQ